MITEASACSPRQFTIRRRLDEVTTRLSAIDLFMPRRGINSSSMPGPITKKGIIVRHSHSTSKSQVDCQFRVMYESGSRSILDSEMKFALHDYQ